MIKKKRVLNRKVVFAIPNKKWGTYYLRGIQVQKELKSKNVDSRIISSKRVGWVKNSIVVFVKHINAELCEIAKKNNNIVIYDILDGYDQSADFQLIDGLVLSTELSRNKFIKSKGLITKVIYHHIDTRFEKIIKHQNQSNFFNMCYIGNLPDKTDNVSFVDKFPDIELIETNTRRAKKNKWMQNVEQFNCHYAVRIDETQRIYKPLAKIGVAAFCNSNIIISKNSAATELLGNEYPYYTEDNYNNVKDVVGFAKSSYGSPVWDKGIEKMEELKHRLSLENIIYEYIDFFKHWD
ncbi:MAG: hypothetical protein B6I20_11320 [Bacteroidetes bacterium 4572_117]|nr:MAG: hypothetical protein B6I20_11320 [Bacteroidetes bacterium 4572_117]